MVHMHWSESSRGAQSSQCYRDEPADCGLARQAAGSCEGVEAEARKFIGRNVIPKITFLRAFDQQISDEVVKPLLRTGDMRALMQKCREFGAVVLVGNERESLEHGFQSLTGVARLIPDCGKLFEVAVDLAFVPGDQDRFDIREVFIQRRTSDASRFGDLRHRHGGQPVLSHQRRSGVQGRVSHRAAVGLDRLVPQFRHRSNIRRDDVVSIETLRLDKDRLS